MKLNNGCKYHGDCFTCPYNDCIADKVAKPDKDKSIKAEYIIYNIKWR